MFRLEETELRNAVDRCKEMHPTVRVIAYSARYRLWRVQRHGKHRGKHLHGQMFQG
jgi:hypothetical protein